MKLSVIILNYNVRYFLELCLLSVEKAIKHLEAEIIVVDNHSNDLSCDMIKNNFPKVVLIENKKNLGFSVGNNIGVTKANGEYLCILNPDTVVAEDIFVRILSFAETQKKMGIIGCKMIDGNGKFLPESKRQIPTPLVSLKKILGFSNSYYANQIEENEKGKVDILAGAFMFLKKNVFEAVNGFDQDYFMYGEDIDLSYKIKQKGYQNYYLGTEKVIHFKGESTLKNKIYRDRFHHAMRLFYKKHFKTNQLYDRLIYLGIYFLKFLPKIKSDRPLIQKQAVLISDKIDLKLQSYYNHHLTLRLEPDDHTKQTKYFFDINVLDFKSIIDIISENDISKQNTFRFFIKESSYIIGSDSKENRGEVIRF